jgi:hypothetical protein
MRSSDFFDQPNPSGRTMALGSTQPPEISTKNLPSVKERPALKADNLTVISKSIFYKIFGSLDVSQPYEPPLSVTGIALPYYYYYYYYLTELQIRFCPVAVELQ